MFWLSPKRTHTRFPNYLDKKLDRNTSKMNSIFLALFLASSSLSTLVSCQQQFEQNRPFAQQPYQQQQQPFQQQAYPQNYGQNMAQGKSLKYLKLFEILNKTFLNLNFKNFFN